MVDKKWDAGRFFDGSQTGVFKMRNIAYKIPSARPAAAGLTETAGHLYNRAKKSGSGCIRRCKEHKEEKHYGNDP